MKSSRGTSMVSEYENIMKIVLFIFFFLSSSLNAISSLAVGGSWGNLHFWRYWESDGRNVKEKMVILNEDSIEVTVKFCLVKYDNDRLIDNMTICGPWNIKAHNYVVVDAPNADVGPGAYLGRYSKIHHHVIFYLI